MSGLPFSASLIPLSSRSYQYDIEVIGKNQRQSTSFVWHFLSLPFFCGYWFIIKRKWHNMPFTLPLGRIYLLVSQPLTWFGENRMPTDHFPGHSLPSAMASEHLLCRNIHLQTMCFQFICSLLES